MHHDNIINDEKGWIAIDLKGIIGGAAFEMAAFDFVPKGIEEDGLRAIFNERVAALAQIAITSFTV